MPIKRHPYSAVGAFTGKYYVVNPVSGLAIESASTQEKAEWACKILNYHEEKNGFKSRYCVQIEEKSQS